jgi:hypothetical protein
MSVSLRALSLTALSLTFALSLLSTSAAFAQAITGYTVQYFNAGASQPLQQSDRILPSAVTCGVTPKLVVTAPAINPTKIAWDDPSNPTAFDCVVDLSTGTSLVAFPVGSYDATVFATNVAGNGPATPRVSFSQAAVPAVLTGLRFTR